MSEILYGILPVKSLRFAKRRLCQELPAAARRALMIELFLTALRALQEVMPAQHILVVSHDRDVLALAQERGAQPLAQRGYGLNGAVREGQNWALQAGADAVLVLLADLPLVTGAELGRLLACSCGGKEEEEEAILAAGQRGGTHALLVRPPGWLSFTFGTGSYARYMAQIERAGGRLAVYESPALALDIDTGEDWQRAACARPELRKIAESLNH